MATLLIVAGAVLLLAGELLAVFNDRRGDTITERTQWLLGIGRPITVWFLASRIVVFGAITWLLLHMAGLGV